MNKLFILLFFISINSTAQFPDTLSSQIKINFIDYLISKNRLEDGIFLLKHFDSIIHNKEICNLHIKTLFDARREFEAEKLINNYSKIQKDTLLKFCTLSLLKNHFALMRRDTLSLLNPKCNVHDSHKKSWVLQLLMFYLINKKDADYNTMFKFCSSQSELSCLEVSSINSVFTDKENYNRKNPLLAGILSSLIPGVGKIYAGKPKEGLTSTIPLLINGALAAEGFSKKGFKSPHFYFFGGFSILYYFSGIVGGVLSAKKKNFEIQKKIELNIEDELYKISRYYW
jgi:hypothetical protein